MLSAIRNPVLLAQSCQMEAGIHAELPVLEDCPLAFNMRILMTAAQTLQKVTLRLSEVRTRLNEISGLLQGETP